MQPQYTNLLDLIPTRKPNAYRVRLNTPLKALFIGLLDMNGEGRFVTKRDEENHFHRNSHGIAINAALLHNPEYKFKWIEVDFLHKDGTQEKLVTSREYIKAKGKPFCYKGWDAQVGVELSRFGREIAERFERESHSQVDLFGAEAA